MVARVRGQRRAFRGVRVSGVVHQRVYRGLGHGWDESRPRCVQAESGVQARGWGGRGSRGAGGWVGRARGEGRGSRGEGEGERVGEEVEVVVVAVGGQKVRVFVGASG